MALEPSHRQRGIALEPDPPGGRPEPSAGRSADPRPPWRLRFAVVEALQFPAVLLLLIGLPWPAAAWGSVVCCAGTDSCWRWRNRLLIAQAAAWLLLALLLGT